MYVNYALTVHNSSGRRNIIAHVIAQALCGDSQGDQLIFQRETRFQRLADIRQRLLKFKIVIVIDGVFEAWYRSSPSSAGYWLPAAGKAGWRLKEGYRLPFRQ